MEEAWNLFQNLFQKYGPNISETGSRVSKEREVNVGITVSKGTQQASTLIHKYRPFAAVFDSDDCVASSSNMRCMSFVVAPCPRRRILAGIGSILMNQSTSVLEPKFVVKTDVLFSRGSRRQTAGIPEVFRGLATPSHARRVVEIDNKFRFQVTAQDPSKNKARLSLLSILGTVLVATGTIVIALSNSSCSSKATTPISTGVKREPANQPPTKGNSTAHNLKVASTGKPRGREPVDKQDNIGIETNSKRLGKRLMTNPGGYELVKIPGGEFKMGSTDHPEELSVHPVTVKEFYMGKYEVTNDDYRKFMSAVPNVRIPDNWDESSYNKPEQPIVGVNWYEAKQYAEWVGGRLPTEAEWEYACRAGTTTEYHSGDTEQDLSRVGWYEGSSSGQPNPVGEKKSNLFGLFDMHGNALEWVEDDWHSSYEQAPQDGTAWVNDPRSNMRVLRGGSWVNSPVDCRSASRYNRYPRYSYYNSGFRVVMDIE